MARINIRFRLRRDNSDNWEENDPVLEAGEPGYELDTHLLRIGNGVDRFSELPAISPGSRGIPGDPGLPGADGDPGPAGPAGADGAPGPKGDKGDIGPQGIQGIQGPTGDQGPMGPGGADGHSFNFKGLWNALTNFAQNDVVYYQGSSWIALNPSTGSEPSESSTDWDEMAMAGAPGAQGTQGPQGLQGPQGDPGPKGDTGDVGPAGPQGPKGDKGDAGVAPARMGMSLVTASLPANGREKLSGAMAFYVANAYKITSNRPARVRFYTTTAKRDADASRAIGTDPTGDHGVLLDAVFTSSMLSLDLSPTVMLHNEESPRVKSLGYIVDNLDANAGTVNINVDLQVIE